MFCNQCGTQLPEGSKFCHICGAKQIIPPVNSDNLNKTEQYSNQTQSVYDYTQQQYNSQTQPVYDYTQQQYDSQTQPVYDYTQQQYDSQTQPVYDYTQQQYNSQTQPAYDNTQNNNDYTKNKKKMSANKKNGLIIGGCIAAVALVALAVVLIVLNPFKKKKASDNPYDGINGVSTEASNTTAVEETTTEDKTTEDKTTEEQTTESEIDSILYVYSWNDEFGDTFLQQFYDKYPEYKDRVIYNNLGTSAEEMLDIVDGKFNGNEVPSIIVCDNEYIDYFFDTEKFCSMDEIGIDDSMLADMYPYSKSVVSYNGKLMGLDPYVCPGGFYYRADIAEAVFGTSDPNVVGQYFTSWDGVLEAAALLKANGYYLVPETDCVARCMGSNYNQSIIDTMINNGYSKGLGEWSSEWTSSFRQDVFGIFGCSWFMYSYAGWEDDSVMRMEVCTVPEAYCWGGVTVGVTKACPDKDLARLVLYETCCNYDSLYNAFEDGSFVNNRSVIASYVQEGKIPYAWDEIYNLDIPVHIISVFDEVGARIGQ